MFDHYAVEYTYPDGAKLYAQARHITKCYDIFSDFAHGAKGSAVIMENLATPKPRIYRNHVQTPENEVWRYKGPEPNPYQREHDLFFEAIRRDQAYNEADRCAKAVMTAILGRMAVYSGQLVTFEQAMASNLELAPGLEKLTLESEAPVMPDAQGRYPIAIPGQTRAF
jgi:hypothetical protein